MLPDTFPQVPDDFSGLVLYEVAPVYREGRGRFWRPNRDGYTDSPSRAGLYVGTAGIRHSARSYAVDARAVLAALDAEAHALREALSTVREGA